MKPGDLRAMTVDQLDDEAMRLKKENFNLRFQRATGQLENTARVRAVMHRGALDLCGSLGLGAWKGLMRRARLLVGNDAGARHVATALGLPVVLVMGPTSLDKTSWNLERVSVLTADVACRPCYLRDCPIDHRCMRGVHVATVLDAARRTL